MAAGMTAPAGSRQRALRRGQRLGAGSSSSLGDEVVGLAGSTLIPQNTTVQALAAGGRVLELALHQAAIQALSGGCLSGATRYLPPSSRAGIHLGWPFHSWQRSLLPGSHSFHNDSCGFTAGAQPHAIWHTYDLRQQAVIVPSSVVLIAQQHVSCIMRINGGTPHRLRQHQASAA